ncbi:MAG: hypothetical protein J6Z28_05490 [Succinivibrio sp.]|nr:hypothetical protein [Succinivibrio sp.]
MEKKALSMTALERGEQFMKAAQYRKAKAMLMKVGPKNPDYRTAQYDLFIIHASGCLNQVMIDEAILNLRETAKFGMDEAAKTLAVIKCFEKGLGNIDSLKSLVVCRYNQKEVADWTESPAVEFFSAVLACKYFYSMCMRSGDFYDVISLGSMMLKYYSSHKNEVPEFRMLVKYINDNYQDAIPEDLSWYSVCVEMNDLYCSIKKTRANGMQAYNLLSAVLEYIQSEFTSQINTINTQINDYHKKSNHIAFKDFVFECESVPQ